MMPSEGTSSLRITSMIALLPVRSAGRVRQQRGVASALDGDGEVPLVLRAGSGRAARHDAPALAHEGLENLGPLVVERQRLLGAETAHAPPAARAPEASARTPLPAAWS